MMYESVSLSHCTLYTLDEQAVCALCVLNAVCTFAQLSTFCFYFPFIWNKRQQFTQIKLDYIC